MSAALGSFNLKVCIACGFILCSWWVLPISKLNFDNHICSIIIFRLKLYLKAQNVKLQ
jgi:hypothetical protein